MKTFPTEIQRSISEAQHGYCKVLNCYDPLVDFHHRVRNTKVNRKLYPNFIDSVYNAVGLCRGCHISRSHLFNITDYEAQLYENWLNEFAEKHYQRGLKDK